MIAIDTNVLLRYLLQDDAVQSPKANALINAQTEILITDTVLVETMWTLRGKKYRLKKPDLLRMLEQLFKQTNLQFEHDQTVWRAMQEYRLARPVSVGSKGREVDFADILILEKARYHSQTLKTDFKGLFTFDVAAQQISGIEAL